MKINAKIDYACRAILELSLHWPGEAPLQIAAIAERQQIPDKFLTQILIHLKHLGYVRSIRGKCGGYLLAKAPRNINLKEIVQSFLENGHEDNQNGLHKKNKDTFGSIWREIEENNFKALEQITFEAILKKERTLNNVPMFAI